MTIHECARRLISFGVAVVPLRKGTKVVAATNYHDLRISEHNISEYFGNDRDIGVLLGSASGCIVDVDLDTSDAKSFADNFLPSTGWIFGRDSDPMSHRLYRMTALVDTIQCHDPRTKEMLVELRSTNAMTRVAPSLHESGEALRWDVFTEPQTITGPLLLRCFHQTALATLLSRYWPSVGSRQEAAIACAGALARLEWRDEDIVKLVRAIVLAAEPDDEQELDRRLSGVRNTLIKLATNEPTTGWPSLSQIVGDDIVKEIRKWFPNNSESFEISSKTSEPRSRSIVTHSPKGIIAAMSEQRALTSWKDSQESIGTVSWLWPKWLPNGFLTMLTAQSGEGKSALAMHIGNIVVTGSYWPDGQPFDTETGGVLWCEAEAGQAMHQQRAIQWGIVFDKFFYPLDDPMQDIRLNVEAHRIAIAEAASHPDIKLVIVDSLRGAVPGDENSSDIIQYTKWLGELARDIDKPVLLLHHVNKSKGDKKEVTLERVRGSSSIVQMARVVWAIDEATGSRGDMKRLRVIKSNLDSLPNNLGISIGENGVIFDEAPLQEKKESQVDRAEAALKQLDFSTPIASDDVYHTLELLDISRDSAKRAKDRLGIEATRQGDKWFWVSASRPEG